MKLEKPFKWLMFMQEEQQTYMVIAKPSAQHGDVQVYVNIKWYMKQQLTFKYCLAHSHPAQSCQASPLDQSQIDCEQTLHLNLATFIHRIKLLKFKVATNITQRYNKKITIKKRYAKKLLLCYLFGSNKKYCAMNSSKVCYS